MDSNSNFLLDFVQNEEKEEFSNSKEGVLKLLKEIGVDTRFVSYFSKEIKESNEIKLYINNLRFSKFSKKRIATFNKYFPNIEVVRSTLFQKICNRASKTLANYLEPKYTILLPKNESPIDDFLAIVLEPYSRKYGINIVSFEDYMNCSDKFDLNLLISPLTLNKEVNFIFSDIFEGIGIEFDKKFKDVSNYFSFDADLNNDLNDLIQNKDIVFPFIDVPEEWINDFLAIDYEYDVDYDDDNIANSFMGFLQEINPQFKENVLKATDFLEINQK